MTRYKLFIFLVLGLAGTAAPAALAATLDIVPPASRIGFRLRAMGLLGLSGHFQQFKGLAVAPPPPAAGCAVQVKVAVGSLVMDDPAWTARALSPALLSADAYPDMTFTGTCRENTLVGRLTLHGVTRPLTLAVQRDGGAIKATGQLRRGDYQVNGMPILVGQQVTITVELPAPRG